MELMQEAVGIAKVNTFVHVKRMKTFRGALQVSYTSESSTNDRGRGLCTGRCPVS